MPAPRKPTHLLEMSGSLAHDPKRYLDRANEPIPTDPLGPPPAHFNAAQKKIWSELESTAPKGVLANSDRWVVETACVLMTRVRSDDFTSADIGHLRSCLASLGMTPADRSRVTAVNEPSPTNDPFSFLDSASTN